MTKPNNTRITPAAANANQRSIFSRNVSGHHHAAVWGDGFLLQMSRDLLADFSDIKGFSKRNLEQMRQWYLFWSNSDEIAQQLVAQLPWRHNLPVRQCDAAIFGGNWMSHDIKLGQNKLKSRLEQSALGGPVSSAMTGFHPATVQARLARFAAAFARC